MVIKIVQIVSVSNWSLKIQRRCNTFFISIPKKMNLIATSSLISSQLSILNMEYNYTPLHRTRGRGGILFYLCPSFRPSKIFFVAFFSAAVDGRNLIFGHKLHIGMPYCGKRFWTRQIPTSCLPTQLVFIHIEHICEGIISEHQLTVHLVLFYFLNSEDSVNK